MQNEKTFLKLFEQRNKDMLTQNCREEINNSSRCIMYRDIKLTFGMESYLNNNVGRYLRIQMSKFRLSSHKLLVERGRWQKPKIIYANRKCTLCNNTEIQDEYHVAIICPHFQVLRQKYIKPYYYQRPSMQKFVELMNTENKRDQYRFMIFIKLLFKEYLESLQK